MASVQRKTDDEEKEKQRLRKKPNATEPPTVQVDMKTHKVRVYPTPSQNKLFHQWLGTARWTYNKCVEAIKQKTAKANKKELRALCITGCMEYMYKYHGHFLALVWKWCTRHITPVKLMCNVGTVDDNPLIENNLNNV